MEAIIIFDKNEPKPFYLRLEEGNNVDFVDLKASSLAGAFRESRGLGYDPQYYISGGPKSPIPLSIRQGTSMKASMIDALAKQARILCDDEEVNADSALQALVGDPADTRTSTFVQFKPNPGTMQLPNPLSPVEGDEIFFSYMMPGSMFQAHDGTQWMIQNYTGPDEVEIYNIWYPRLQSIVSLNDVRRSIHQWTSPITQTVPPPPPGVDYGALPVKIVDGPGRYGDVDEITDYKSDNTGGW